MNLEEEMNKNIGKEFTIGNNIYTITSDVNDILFCLVEDDNKTLKWEVLDRVPKESENIIHKVVCAKKKKINR